MKKRTSTLFVPVEKPRDDPATLRTFEVGYLCDVVKYLSLIDNAGASLVSVANGGLMSYVITYWHKEAIEMEVLC